jgi:predicted DNA binding CopG/RHH family protein
MKRKSKSLRKLPKMKSDRQAARFVADADLTRYDLSSMQPLRFEFARKEARVNMRLPNELLEAVKAAAERKGVPYQRFIRQALERALQAA